MRRLGLISLFVITGCYRNLDFAPCQENPEADICKDTGTTAADSSSAEATGEDADTGTLLADSSTAETIADDTTTGEDAEASAPRYRCRHQRRRTVRRPVDADMRQMRHADPHMHGGIWSAWLVNTGATLDTTAGTWSSLPTAGAPIAREFATSVWTGKCGLVWSGIGSPGGGILEPLTDRALYCP